MSVLERRASMRWYWRIILIAAGFWANLSRVAASILAKASSVGAMSVTGPAPDNVSVNPAACSRLTNFVKWPSSVINCKMVFVGAAVVDVAPVEVDVLGNVVVLAADDVDAGAVVAAVPEPPPQAANTTAREPTSIDTRPPLTGWTLPAEPRMSRSRVGVL